MTNHQGKRIVALGEILWDVFPDKKHPGGGPLNFALHASQFGHRAWVISRVGHDALGRELLDAVREMRLPTDFIQVDSQKPTGTATVSVNLFGEPKFEIARDVAWDNIEATPEAYGIALSADVIWYGMLAQRSKPTRNAIRSLLAAAKSASSDILIVCELHLRQRFYSPELIRQSLEFCTLLRLNEDEHKVVKGLFGRASAADRQFALELMDTFSILMVCITHGPRGCTLHTPDAEVHSPGFVVDVVDTVGTGRAFTAAMVTKLLQGARFNEVARYANLAGAYVATQPGATPRFTPYVLQRFELELEGGLRSER
jgi:fructokinase